MQMHWLAMIMCLYAGLASARTEEDQQASNIDGIPNSPPVQCFYRQAAECPNIGINSNKCPCKKITLANVPELHAALCCNIDSQTLDYGLSCMGECYCCKNFFQSYLTA